MPDGQVVKITAGPEQMDPTVFSGMITVLGIETSTELPREVPDQGETGHFRQHLADLKSANRQISAE